MEIVIHSVAEYIEKCLAAAPRKEQDVHVFYRGAHQIYDTPHIPSIYYDPKLIEHEDTIFKEVLAYFPEMLALKSTVERLIFMQHYSFPTRILDISHNPLTALFFACFPDKEKDSLQKDGIVYLYSVPKADIKYCDSDAVSVIANLCRRSIEFSIKDIYHLERDEFNKQDEILYLIHEIGEEKPYFHPVINKADINSVVCLRPRLNNPRIVRQDGYFFLFGINYEKKRCASLPSRWIQDRRCRIPRAAKKKILADLDALNINEAFVYPDYEHISALLRTRYTTKKEPL